MHGATPQWHRPCARPDEHDVCFNIRFPVHWQILLQPDDSAVIFERLTLARRLSASRCCCGLRSYFRESVQVANSLYFSGTTCDGPSHSLAVQLGGRVPRCLDKEAHEDRSTPRQDPLISRSPGPPCSSHGAPGTARDSARPFPRLVQKILPWPRQKTRLDFARRSG